MNQISNCNFRLRASRFLVAITLLCIAAIFVPTLAAQTASAGAVIGNQATATYNDAQGVSRQAFSNLVQTTVSQVYSGTLTNTQSRYATVGTQVVFPHTYTNNGNGSDTVALTLGVATANFTNPAIYTDANGDGVPDNTTNIAGNTFTLAAGQVLKVVVVGTLGTLAGATESDTLIATPAHGVATGSPNTDTITRTANAAIAVTKSMSASSGIGGNVVGVTLTYTNTGNATATAVVLADPLGSTGIQASSTTFVYKANSGMLNGATLTDGSGGWIVTGNTPTLTIASVAPGVTGTVTFNVTVGALATIGGTVNNTATFAYNDGAGPIAATNTNTVPFTIQQNAAVTWTAGDVAPAFTGGNPATDDLGAQTFNQGGVVTFTNTVTNSGNGLDTLNITYNGSTFPAGTTFQFFRFDGLTPLTDSNGDGIIDVGPVGALGTTTIKVKAILPAGTTTGAVWLVNVVATSTAATANNFATAIATIIDKVTATVATSTVDLTVTAPALGTGPFGAGSGKASGVAQAVDPGAQVTFPFYVQNTSSQTGTADSYSLLVQTTASTGNVTVASLSPNSSVVPLGWTAIFHSGNCAAAPVTSTNPLTAAKGTNTAGSSQLLCLELDIPAGYTGSTTNFLVQALSNSTGAIDQIQFAVTVNTVHRVAVTPNQSGQIYAGGTITYKHVITNAGNFAETVTFPAGTFPAATTVAFNPALPGWTATVYQDSISNGVLDGADALIVPGTTTLPLPIGGSLVVFVKVQAAPSASAGDTTDSTFTVQYFGALSVSADDTTTVIAGQIKLVKSQFVDTGCAKPGSPAWTTGSPAGGVKSGQCIMYQIVATNTGTTNADNVKFTDAAPAYTTYLDASTPTVINSCGMTIAAPGSWGPSVTAPFSYAFGGSMTPSCTATITFEVKLN